LKTLGDDLRKKRLDLKLLQKEVAQKLCVDKTSIYNWENNRTFPFLYRLPKIIEFLGYVPYDASTNTLGEKMNTSRRFLGVTQKELARRLGIDPTTLGQWEKDKSRPSKKQLKKLDNLFTSLSSGHLSLPLNSLVSKSLREKKFRITGSFGYPEVKCHPK